MGNDLPVSTFVDRMDGSIEMGLTAYEKLGIAVSTPKWDKDYYGAITGSHEEVSVAGFDGEYAYFGIVEASKFDLASLVYERFHCLYFWCQIQKTVIVKTDVKELTAYVFF